MRSELATIEGTLPDPYADIKGCPFFGRCLECEGLTVCRDDPYALTKVGKRILWLARGFACATEYDTESSGAIVPESEVLLELTDLKKHFPIRKGVFKKVVAHVKAVDGVNFSIHPGETVGLVGESGCGKEYGGPHDNGSVQTDCRSHLVQTADGRERVDIAAAEHSRCDRCGPSFKWFPRSFRFPQSPNDGQRNSRGTARSQQGCKGPRTGGSRQRVGRAGGAEGSAFEPVPPCFFRRAASAHKHRRALALSPRLLVADEPTSALDVSVQAQIVNLALEIQDQLGLSYLFISHDLGLIRHFSRRIVLMYVGRVVEYAPAEPLFARPRHPYTEALMSNVPTTRPELVGRKIILKGEPADPINPPRDARFIRGARTRRKSALAWYRRSGR